MNSKNILQNALDKDKFEEFLIANWSQFLNSSKLLAYVIQNVKNNTNNFGIISASTISLKSNFITISRFDWKPQGFILWVEFNIPLTTDKTAEGTMEILLSNDGILSQIQTIGNIHSKN
jgi:hypothetical protein